MGGTSYSSTAYSDLGKSRTHQSTNTIFTNTAKGKMGEEMNPKGVDIRESRDSDLHPNSLAIFFGLDETGSMGSIPVSLVKGALVNLMDTMIKHGVQDPQVLFAGIGDHISDTSPFQIGQFESGDKELDKWLTALYLEGNGGGQNMESYLLAWYFAARHTSIDCFEKRGEKGFLFTVGDEWTHPRLSKDYIQGIFGDNCEGDLAAEHLLEEASRKYHVYHLHCMETSTGQSDVIQDKWKTLLGERVIFVNKHEDIPEIVGATVAMMHGVDLDSIAKDLDPTKRLAVTSALAHLDVSLSKQSVNTPGVVEL